MTEEYKEKEINLSTMTGRCFVIEIFEKVLLCTCLYGG